MRPTVRTTLWRFAFSFLLWAGSAISPCAAIAREHVEGFEDERPTWQAFYDQTAVSVKGHARSNALRHSGESAELVELEGFALVSEVLLEQTLPAARLIDELTLELWFNSNQDGAALSVRVVLPRQIDPRTGKAMAVRLAGTTYEKPGQWKRLACDQLPQRLKRMLPQLRRSLQSATGERQDIDSTGAYVDAAIVTIRMGRGRSRFAIDDLKMGPLVDASADRQYQQIAAVEAHPQPDAEFKLDRLFVKKQPFFLRAVPYHGERPADLARMRLNVAWVPDFRDTDLLADLNDAGLRAMAVPPRPTSPDGAPLDPESAHIAPFGNETAPILFWYLGTRIPPQAKHELAQWDEQIRNADRQLRRPVMGDVVGLERAYSRQLSMLGVSRPALHTTAGLRTYRDWLIERRMQAQPGSFLWTWLQTEATPAASRQREAAGWSPMVVEPEQLRLEVYAAIAAGYRGLGFWTHTPLDAESAGSRERQLMIAQLGMELELLEPWLATGTPISQTPFKAQLPPGRNTRQLGTPSGMNTNPRGRRELEAKLNDRNNQLLLKDQLSRDLEAVILRTDYGMLVLPIWYGEEAQFVPGQMTANNASIVVPGVGQTARAYEVSTTDVIELTSTRVTGGKQVTLKKFDVTSVILLTDDALVVERLREKVRTMSESSARICLELARAKFERVAQVDRRLREYGMGQIDGLRILDRARGILDQAEGFAKASRFHDARMASDDCLQLMRILQHACWSDAARRMYSPVSSPHTLCFQTLPDHWDMIARFGRARHSGGRNVLRSGECEDFDTMVAEGWRRDEIETAGVRTSAELYPRPHAGTYCLRLIAVPATGKDAPTVIAERPVSVTTPPVTVYKGQLVYISGWVKVAAPSLANLDGAIFYDSIGGAGTALRWRKVADWHQFELVREVVETTDLTLTMALSGLGEICFDDLQIIPLETTPETPSPGESAPQGGRPSRQGIADFFKKLPGFGGKSGEPKPAP